jgi:hypothetical protein
MNQSNAADATRHMAEACAAMARNAGETERIYKRVENAVFNQAFEFIPDSAIYAVVDKHREPKLVALDGRQFFLLTVGDLAVRTVGAPSTTCEMITLDPLDAVVKCKTEFNGVRTNADPMERQTTWTFRLGKIGLSINTQVVPESERVEGCEDFAQALAAALGWQLPQAAQVVELEVA